MAGVSFPPFFLGAVLIYYLGYKLELVPDRRLRPVDRTNPGSGHAT